VSAADCTYRDDPAWQRARQAFTSEDHPTAAASLLAHQQAAHDMHRIEIAYEEDPSLALRLDELREMGAYVKRLVASWPPIPKSKLRELAGLCAPEAGIEPAELSGYEQRSRDDLLVMLSADA
jgi:hypothetical protein